MGRGVTAGASLEASHGFLWRSTLGSSARICSCRASSCSDLRYRSSRSREAGALGPGALDRLHLRQRLRVFTPAEQLLGPGLILPRPCRAIRIARLGEQGGQGGSAPASGGLPARRSGPRPGHRRRPRRAPGRIPCGPPGRPASCPAPASAGSRDPRSPLSRSRGRRAAARRRRAPGSPGALSSRHPPGESPCSPPGRVPRSTRAGRPHPGRDRASPPPAPGGGAAGWRRGGGPDGAVGRLRRAAAADTRRRGRGPRRRPPPARQDCAPRFRPGPAPFRRRGDCRRLAGAGGGPLSRFAGSPCCPGAPATGGGAAPAGEQGVEQLVVDRRENVSLLFRGIFRGGERIGLREQGRRGRGRSSG